MKKLLLLCAVLLGCSELLAPPTTPSPPQFGCREIVNRSDGGFQPCERVWACYEQNFSFDPVSFDARCLREMQRQAAPPK